MVPKGGDAQLISVQEYVVCQIGNESYERLGDRVYQAVIKGSKAELYISKRRLFLEKNHSLTEEEIQTYQEAFGNYYLRVHGQLEPFHVSKIPRNFRYFMQVLDDCKEVHEKIQKKKYKYKDLIEIVNVYNNCPE